MHTGHCTRKIKPVGYCRRSCLTHGASVAPFGRCEEVSKSRCYSSIPSPPGATGVTLALIKMRPDFEHKAAARGILPLPAHLCFTLMLEEADGSEVYVVPHLRSHQRAPEPCSGTRGAALMPGDTVVCSRALGPCGEGEP